MSHPLHPRAEWIETEEMKAIHAAADQSIRRQLGLSLERIGGAWCSRATQDPSILLNRAIGLGEQGPVSVQDIRDIKTYYTEAGIEEFFLHVDPETVDAGILQEGGMQKSRGWMKFTRKPDTAALHSGQSDLSVRKIGPEHAADFARIVSPCFDMLPVSEALLAAMVDHPDMHVYMSFDGDSPAGTGAMFIKDKIAYMDWASTHADYRRRGSQGALLKHRIEQAIAMGCTLMVAATGEEVPGDPQHSYKNILRYGFEETYLRENWTAA